MADDITLDAGAGGPTVRALSDGTDSWPVGVTAYPTGGSAGAWSLQIVDLTHGLPVVPQTGATFAVTDGGGSITIDGNVGVVGAVEITNDAGNPIPVSGTFWQATQPVSGTVTANLGTVAGLALDATLTGGSLVAKAVGDVAHDAVDSGNPVKIGGLAANGPPTSVSAGDRVAAYFDQRGRLGVVLGSSSVDVNVLLIGDTAGAAVGLQTASFPLLYNPAGLAWDRMRANHEVTALASAARTASVNSSDLTNYNHRGVNVVLDITAGGGAGSLTVAIKGKDTLSGKYVTLFSSGAIAAPGVSTHLFVVYPGVVAAAYAAGVGKADFPLPRLWRVEVTAADGTSYTYSIGVNYIL